MRNRAIVIKLIQSMWPRWAAAIAFRLWVTPRFWRMADSAERPSTSDAARTWLSHGGFDLSVVSMGDGPVVLLVHGWGGRAHDLEPLASRLAAAGFTAISADLPGHGESGGDVADPELLADAIVGMANSYGPLAGIVGHSMGGLCVTLALARRLDVPRVVLVAPFVRPEETFARFCDGLGLSRTTRGHLERRIQNHYGEDVWERTSADRVAASLDTPALIIHDQGDREVSLEDAKALVDSWVGSELMETSGFGHRRVLAAPIVIHRTVDFLRGVSDSSQDL